MRAEMQFLQLETLFLEFIHQLLLQMLMKMAGFTLHSSMMVEPILVESTSTVFLTGKVKRMHLMVVDTSLSVHVITVKLNTEVLSTRLLSGTRPLLQPRLLNLPLVEAQSHHFLMKTVTDSPTFGRTSMQVISLTSVLEFTRRNSLLPTVVQT